MGIRDTLKNKNRIVQDENNLVDIKIETPLEDEQISEKSETEAEIKDTATTPPPAPKNQNGNTEKQPKKKDEVTFKGDNQINTKTKAISGIKDTTTLPSSSKKQNGNAVKPHETVSERRVGRPRKKLGEYRSITIELSEELINMANIAKIKYNNNLTFYIQTLIENDIKAHKAEYKEIYQEKLNYIFK